MCTQPVACKYIDIANTMCKRRYAGLQAALAQHNTYNVWGERHEKLLLKSSHSIIVGGDCSERACDGEHSVVSGSRSSRSDRPHHEWKQL